MENLSKNQKIIIGIIAVIMAIVVGYYFYNNIQQLNYEFLEDEEQEEIEEIETNEEETIETIIVHIAGAVKKEGIVTLNEGARIIDAINQAGGLENTADLTNVNLAYIISDGQKIYIPHKGEETKIDTENGENIIQNNKEEGATNTTTININTATINQLQELPRNRKFNSTKNNRLSNRKRKIQNNRRYKKCKWNRRLKIQQHKRLYNSKINCNKNTKLLKVFVFF